MSSDHSSRFIGSFIGSGVAEMVTLPIDTAKVRLQVQHSVFPPRYSGMVHVWSSICKEETPRHLWAGLTPALIRQCCYSSMSLVLYEPIRNTVHSLTSKPGEEFGYTQRLLSGGTAGAISIFVFNWTEVIKTRMQTNTGSSTVSSTAKQIYSSKGILGFWAGIRPNIARTFLVNAAELGTYDAAKHHISYFVGDTPMAHIGASSIAGVASAITSTPADVVKTRMMNSTNTEYTGVLNAVKTIWSEEGVSAFYKGFFPIVLRKVVWCSTFFLGYEQLRTLNPFKN